MTDLYDKIVQQRGSLEQLVARIPGFRGYQESQARRTADRLLRDHLAGQIAQRNDRLVRIEKVILSNMGMEYMPKTRNVKGKIQLYHDKVKTAAPGYSGMWAQMKIGPEELERIYSFDEAQIRYVESLDLYLDKLEQAAMQREGLDEAIWELDGAVEEAISAFSLRDDVLTDLSQSL
jgi:hypothetical protein